MWRHDGVTLKLLLVLEVPFIFKLLPSVVSHVVEVRRRDVIHTHHIIWLLPSLIILLYLTIMT